MAGLGEIRRYRGFRAVAALSALALVGTLGYRSTVPVAGFYARSVLGLSALAVGGMTSAFYLLRAGASVASGAASATARRASRLASAAFAGHVAVVAYLASGPGYVGLLAIRGLQGLLNGLAWTAAQVMLASSAPAEYRGRAFAVYGISGSLGALAGDTLYASLGPSCLTVSMAAFAAASVFSLAMPAIAGGATLTPAGRPGSPAPARGVGALGGGRCVLVAVVLAVASVSYASVMGVGDIAYIYYRETLGITKGETATLRGSAGFAGTLAGYLLGWLADRGAPLEALVLAYLAAYSGIVSASIRSKALAALGIALITAAGRAALPTARKLASEQPRGHLYLGLLGAATNLASAAGGLAYGYAYTALDSRQLTIGPLSLSVAPLGASLWALVAVPPLLAACIRRGRDNPLTPEHRGGGGQGGR